MLSEASVGHAFVHGRSKLRWSTVLAQAPPQALGWPTVFSLAQVHQKPKELVEFVLLT